MTTYQRVLSSTILGSGLVILIEGSLIFFDLVKPPVAQAILLIVISAFAIVGVIALTLLLISFLNK